MAIWHGEFDVDYAGERGEACMVEHLGIEIVEAGDDFLKGRMPVDARTRQPAGALHGGASVALAETLASWAATFCVDRSRFHCVGMEINANHVRPVTGGFVEGVARPVHLGRATQIWEVRITDKAGKLSCISRVTMAVLERASSY
jgi:1,4-dihydroxy-2-naphthoyl-CoA hydrolase